MVGETELPVVVQAVAVQASDVEETTLVEDPKKCIICIDKPRAMRLLPCGHCSTCDACTSQLCNGQPVCPVCRAPFNRLARIPTPDDTAEPLPVRVNTYEAAGDGTFSMSIGQYLASTAPGSAPGSAP